MPTNLYGENDNFHLSNSHVIPALLRKIHLAKCIEEENWESIKYDLAKNPIDGIDNKSSQNEVLAALDRYGIHCDLATMNFTVNIWGTGNVKREFLYVDDMALAAIFILELNQKAYQENTQPMLSHINVGTGLDVKINVLAQKIKEVVGFKGNLFFDSSKLDGPLRKLTDVSKISNMGWKADINLEKGLRKTYTWYLN
jgi:GDP-L-fucose synthase